MRVHITDHPQVTHKLTVLRDARTPSPVFRSLVSELVTLLAYEATRDIRVREVDVVAGDAVIGATWPGFVPQETCGKISAASRVTSLSKAAPSSVGRVFQ